MLSRSRIALIVGLAFTPAVVSTALAQNSARDAFAREPKTPLEIWEVANYLVRIGQPDQAVPYLKKFLDLKPDDSTILEVRDTYGVGSILSLSNDPETRPFARTLANRLAEASIRTATDPGRMARAIEGLSKSREEQIVAVERLREAGPYAVAPWLRALSVSGLTPSTRTPLADNLGRLDKNAVPALIAALDHPEVRIVGDVARALGRIGDTRAIPALTNLAARTNPPGFAKFEAREAIRRLTGRDFGSQAVTPSHVLGEEARRYHEHLYRFPGDPVVLWLWDPSAKAPAAVQVPVRDAEGILGLRAAKEALDLDPANIDAKVLQLSLGLDHDPEAWRALALEAGPSILGKVLNRAVADKRTSLAATVAPLLGQLTNRNDLLVNDRPNSLVRALGSPDRRTQFAAAEALVKLDPRKSFSGSSRLVPILARFLPAQANPRALVIDGNPERASQTSGFLRGLGYDARTSSTGVQGFTEASEAADIELITIDPNFVGDSWKLADLLGNLKADPRTSGIPIFLVGPLALRDQLASQLESFPDVQFLVTPTETRLLKPELDRGLAVSGVRPFSAAERSDYARRAAALLATIARSPGSPFEADLPAAEPALTLALNGPIAAVEAAQALGDVPGSDAQRALADVALDTSKPAPTRLAAAWQLSRNVGRFGPRLVSEQERRLAEELGQQTDPSLRDAFAAVVGTLKPGPDASASLPSAYRPSFP